MAKQHAEVKVMTLGDETSGKIKLLQCLRQKIAPGEQNNTRIFEGHSLTIATANSDLLVLSLWDVSGQENYSSLRCLQYSNMDLFLMCFSLTNEQSFINIKEKWFKEVKEYCPNTPTILVGTKLEKRNQQKTISSSQGLQMKKTIGATHYIECSYKTNEGLEQLLTEITRNECSIQQCQRKFKTCTLV